MSASKRRGDNRDEDRIINDLITILGITELHPDTRRAVIYKAIQDITKLRVKDAKKTSRPIYISHKAAKENGPLQLEHVVPIGQFTDALAPQEGPPFTDVSQLRKALTEVLTLCWVLKQEHVELTNADRRLDPTDPRRLNELLRATDTKSAIFERYAKIISGYDECKWDRRTKQWKVHEEAIVVEESIA